jgi:Protein of unknown function (DUF559)
MARPHRPLPASLPATFSLATAAKAGVGEGRLRADDLTRPCRGVRSRRPVTSLWDVVLALAEVLPAEAVFSHSTALLLQRLPNAGLGSAVHVTTPPGSVRVNRTAVIAHRARIGRTSVLRGVRVSDPAAAWAALGHLAPLDELVALADAIAYRHTSLEPLAAEVDLAQGRRGARRLREAMGLARLGAESVMETKARLLMVRAGLAEPELNVDILDGATGEWLARADFVWREQRVVVEYEGDHHRTDRAQWRADIARRRLLEEAGWRVILITADDVLRRPEQLVAMLRAALRAE